RALSCVACGRQDAMAAKTKSSSKFVLYAALAGNLLVALTKFGAAWWTGSSAMLSEGLHSLVDTGNQMLLLYGMRRSERPPDADREPVRHACARRGRGHRHRGRARHHGFHPRAREQGAPARRAGAAERQRLDPQARG